MSAKLLKGDCLKLMEGVKSHSIDLILADLPYGTTASNWDKIIDFSKLWQEYERLITDQGAIVLFSSGTFTNKLVNSNSALYRYKWIWVKNRSSNFLNAKNRPMTKYEEICVFSKGITANTKNKKLKMNYYPQGLKPIYRIHRDSPEHSSSLSGKRPGHRTTIQRWTGYPNDVLFFNCVSKKEHTNQKPVDLLQYLIKTYTDEGMTVLDNTMGSGSTGVAAVSLKRNFIGMELDDDYFKVAKERIEKVDRSTLASF